MRRIRWWFLALLLAAPALAHETAQEQPIIIWTQPPPQPVYRQGPVLQDVWIPYPMAPRVPRQPPPGVTWQPNDQPRPQYLPVYPAPEQPRWGETWKTNR